METSFEILLIIILLIMKGKLVQILRSSKSIGMRGFKDKFRL